MFESCVHSLGPTCPAPILEMWKARKTSSLFQRNYTFFDFHLLELKAYGAPCVHMSYKVICFFDFNFFGSTKRSRDKNVLSTLYEDFVQSGENWMASSLAVRLSKTSNQKRRGRHVLLPLHKVKKKFGAPIAMQILQDKREKENAKPPGNSCIYWMEHPEPALRGQEET